MSIPGAASPLFIGAAAADAAAFQIDRSIRINDDDTAYLNRTPSSAGNQKTWTWSAWVKRSKLSAEANLFSVGASSTDAAFRFNSDDTLQVRDGNGGELTTNAVFRDPSAWYHIVVSLDTTQSTAADRFKVYINGTEQTYSASTYASQNADGDFNAAVAHYIGRQVHNTSNLFDGYLTEIHFVDGTQLAASDFGEYDDNNNWNPKDCQSSLTYGTNGFYLKFADNTSTTTISEDSSGNNNDWTANNISVSSGSGNDSLIDTPTNYTPDSGNPGGNYATFSPIDSHSSNTFANGNLEATNAGTSVFANLTMGFTSGKWYCEIEADGGGSSSCMVGIVDLNERHSQRSYGSAGGFYMYQGTGGLYSGGLGGSFSNGSYGSSFSDGDIIGIGLDMDNGNVRFYINGSDQGQANTSSLAGALVSPAVNNDTNSATFKLNTGQRPFAHTPPTDHKAMCTTNLADPAVADGSTAVDVLTWTGNAATRTLSGLNFTNTVGLAWVKNRSNALNHVMQDVVRGFATGKKLAPNEPDSEGSSGALADSYGYISGASSTGFTIDKSGSGQDWVQMNNSSNNYVSWVWDAGSSTSTNSDGSITTNVRANVSAGFSIIGYTGNATVGATIGHGLNSAPEWLVFKNREEAAGNWYVYHKSAGHTKYLTLDRTHAATTHDFLNNTAPTNSVVTLNNTAEVNATGQGIICYAWTSVSQYSSFGSYVGNGSSSGPFVFTGFRPKWILLKRSDGGTENWTLWDTERNTYNVMGKQLYPNLTAAEADAGTNSSYGILDSVSNGFKLRGSHSSFNSSGGTFIYAAFAEHPFKTARAR